MNHRTAADPQGFDNPQVANDRFASTSPSGPDMQDVAQVGTTPRGPSRYLEISVRSLSNSVSSVQTEDRTQRSLIRQPVAAAPRPGREPMHDDPWIKSHRLQANRFEGWWAPPASPDVGWQIPPAYLLKDLTDYLPDKEAAPSAAHRQGSLQGSRCRSQDQPDQASGVRCSGWLHGSAYQPIHEFAHRDHSNWDRAFLPARPSSLPRARRAWPGPNRPPVSLHICRSGY